MGLADLIPAYYVPPGVTPPGYLDPVWGCEQLREDRGPEGLPPGGLHYGGGGWRDDRSGWRQTPMGWAIAFPPGWRLHGDLLRVDALAGYALPTPAGEILAPQILDSDRQTCVVGNILRLQADGSMAFEPPADLAGLIRRLRTLAADERDGGRIAAENTDLLLEVLALNYHLGPVEWSELGALTPEVSAAVLGVACGMVGGEDLGDG